MLRSTSRLWTALLTCVVSGAACSGVEAPRSERVPIVMGTGPSGGGFLSFGRALEPQMQSRLFTLALELRVSRGAVHNLSAVGRGEFDCAFTYADVAYEAAGRKQVGEADIAVENIRAIATLQLTPVQLVARAGSGIRAIPDLAGKRAGLGAPGGATLLTTQSLLGAYDLRQAVHPIGGSLAEVASKLVTGEADAVFDIAIYSDALAGAIAHGAYLVPIEGPIVDQLREARPFLRPLTMAAGTYREMRSAVTTIAVESLLVCRRSLSEAAAQELTGAVIGAMEALAPVGKWNLVQMDAVPATSIPLHPGAALYYRESELMR